MNDDVAVVLTAGEATDLYDYLLNEWIPKRHENVRGSLFNKLKDFHDGRVMDDVQRVRASGVPAGRGRDASVRRVPTGSSAADAERADREDPDDATEAAAADCQRAS